MFPYFYLFYIFILQAEMKCKKACKFDSSIFIFTFFLNLALFPLKLFSPMFVYTVPRAQLVQIGGPRRIFLWGSPLVLN